MPVEIKKPITLWTSSSVTIIGVEPPPPLDISESSVYLQAGSSESNVGVNTSSVYLQAGSSESNVGVNTSSVYLQAGSSESNVGVNTISVYIEYTII